MKNLTSKNQQCFPPIRIGMYEGETENVKTTLHYQSDIKLISVYEGSISCAVGGKNYIAGPGDILFINSEVAHKLTPDEKFKAVCLVFSELDFMNCGNYQDLKYAMRYRSQVSAPVYIYKNSELFNTVDEIYNESLGNLPAQSIFIKAGIYRIIAQLCRSRLIINSDELLSSKEMKKLLPAITYINENYMGSISLETVSNLINFDQSYFCRIFKNIIGTTFIDYLNFIKVYNAESLLLNTRDSILSISQIVGFSSVSYFNRIFKRYTGFTPKLYRTIVSRAIADGLQNVS